MSHTALGGPMYHQEQSFGKQCFSPNPDQHHQEIDEEIVLSPSFRPPLQYIGVGKRALALLIDLLVYCVAMSLLVLLTGGIGTPLSLFLWLVYCTCMEAMKGATIG